MTTSNAGKEAEKVPHSDVAGANVKWHSHSGKHSGSFLRANHATTIQHTKCTPGHFSPQEWRLVFHKKTLYMNVSRSFIHNSQKLGANKTQMTFTGGMVKDTWYIRVMGYCSAVNRNGLFIHATTWKWISKESCWAQSPSQKAAGCIIPFI